MKIFFCYFNIWLSGLTLVQTLKYCLLCPLCISDPNHSATDLSYFSVQVKGVDEWTWGWIEAIMGKYWLS